MQKKRPQLYFLFICVFLGGLGLTLGYLPPSLEPGSWNKLPPALQANPTVITPMKDTYVSSGDPMSNFGGQDYLYIGTGVFDEQQYAYLSYDLSSQPTSFTNAYLMLDPISLYSTMNVTVCQLKTGETWEEYSITFMNRPTEFEQAIDGQVYVEDENFIDITAFFAENTLSTLDIMMNASIMHSRDFSIYSREWESDFFPPVSLYFTETGGPPYVDRDYYDPVPGELLSTADTYIDSGYALDNHGGLDTLYMGTDLLGDIHCAIVRFEHIPTDLDELTFSLDVFGVYATADLYLTVFSSTSGQQPWNETTLNWLNWPYAAVTTFMQSEHVDIIQQVTGAGEISINLADWIGAESLDIIITLDLLTEEYFMAYSYEGSGFLSSAPKLIYSPFSTTSTLTTTTTGNDITQNSGTGGEGITVAGFPILILMSMSGIVGIIILQYNRRNQEIIKR